MVRDSGGADGPGGTREGARGARPKGCGVTPLVSEAEGPDKARKPRWALFHHQFTLVRSEDRRASFTIFSSSPKSAAKASAGCCSRQLLQRLKSEEQTLSCFPRRTETKLLNGSLPQRAFARRWSR